MKKSAAALALGSAAALTLAVRSDPDVRPSALLTLAARGLVGAAGVCACLVALLRITSWLEGVSHALVGLLTCTSPWTAAVTGLAVGTLHTVSGPDHLAGLAPLVIGQRRSPGAAFGLGALWGTGHATGQALIGLACLAVHAGLLRTAWASALGQASGGIVGASLIAIGLLGLREAREFEDEVPSAGAEVGGKGRRFGWATYATGVLHGLSPDAVLFLAPAFALPRLAAATHVAGVVLGTLLSMGVCTALLGALCHSSPRVTAISTIASSTAMLLGLCILASALGLTTPFDSLG